MEPQAPNSPSPAAPLVSSEPQIAGPENELTPSETSTMIAWAKEDLLKGKITQDQADKIFRQLAATPEQKAPDTRTPEQKRWDQVFPAAKPEDFTIPWEIPGPLMTKEDREADQTVRTWMTGAGLDRGTGNSLVTSIERVAIETKGLSADQLEHYGHMEFEKLQKAHGDKLEDRLRLVGKMVAEIEAKKPGVIQFLQSKGVGDNAIVANMLIAAADRYYSRRGQK